MESVVVRHRRRHELSTATRDLDITSSHVLIELQEVVVVVNTFRGDEDEDEQG
jgi:hypothetical protein